MATEFEHKLLVIDDSWRAGVVASSTLSQAYLCARKGMTVRVRVVDQAEAYLTIKGARSGIGRPEFEYAIPVADAEQLLTMVSEGFPITKTRHQLGGEWAGWVVDEFGGENAGLVLAELEVETADTGWQRPSWAGPDVTTDDRYTNAVLYTHPYARWTQARGRPGEEDRRR